MLRPVVLAVLAASALLGACRVSLEEDFEESQAGVDAGPVGDVPPGPGTAASCVAAGTAAATLTQVHTLILGTVNCNSGSCHDDSQPEADLDFTTVAKTYASLVSQPSTLEDGYLLVVPNEPTKSYLLRRMRHIAAAAMNPPLPEIPSAERKEFYMPQNSNGLCEQKRQLVERWIMAGAPAQ